LTRSVGPVCLGHLRSLGLVYGSLILLLTWTLVKWTEMQSGLEEGGMQDCSAYSCCRGRRPRSDISSSAGLPLVNSIRCIISLPVFTLDHFHYSTSQPLISFANHQVSRTSNYLPALEFTNAGMDGRFLSSCSCHHSSCCPPPLTTLLSFFIIVFTCSAFSADLLPSLGSPLDRRST